MEEKRERKFKVAIDRYIGLPIFSLIVKHFNIIDIGFEKKTITDFFFHFISHIHNYTEYNQQWNVFSVFHTHLEQWTRFTQEKLQHDHRK